MRHTKWLACAALSVSFAACNQIAGIHEGVPRQESALCSAVSDCAVEFPACRTAVACDAGRCVFDDAPAGMPLEEQTPGDCVEVACDGSGRTQVVAAESDFPDDGNPCTIEACAGTTPTRTVLPEVDCYNGALGTEGKGVCQGGVQRCDAEGNPVGDCLGEVVPTAERCDVQADDEDCDGQTNEEGANCVCGDGFVSAGEECDDGGTVAGDRCSATCARERVLQVATGQDHTCALLNDGRIKCWGHDVGDAPGEMGDNLPAVNLGGGRNVQAIAAHYGQTCALLKDGKFKCFGTGTGPEAEADANPDLDLGYRTVAIAIAVGGGHRCAIRSDGPLTCWGFNGSGQLGVGDTVAREPFDNSLYSVPLVDLGTESRVVGVAAGQQHTCAILYDGTVKCWGNQNGLMLDVGDDNNRGDEPSEMGNALPVVPLGVGKKAVSLDAGKFHACAVMDSGEVKCWGANFEGSLGWGDQMPDADGVIPTVDLGEGRTARAVTTGNDHSCALLDDGSVKCWGYNQYGQLGLGDNYPRGRFADELGENLKAVDLGPGLKAVSISAHYYHTCAVLDDGSVKCWGQNYEGQLGQGDTMMRGNAPNQMGDTLPRVKLFSALW